MSAVLTALEDLAIDNNTAWFRLSAISQAVLFYATPYLTARYNFLAPGETMADISDADWDAIQAYVDGLLYEAKNPMIGMIIPFMTESPPGNVLACDGSTYLRVDFPELFAVLDSIFIVDSDHFTVPDLRGRTVIGAGDGSGLSSRAVGSNGGEEDHQLTEGELASHSHSVELTTGVPGVAPGEVAFDTTIPILTDSTGSTGGDSPHNNMQPFYSLNYGVIAS